MRRRCCTRREVDEELSDTDRHRLAQEGDSTEVGARRQSLLRAALSAVFPQPRWPFLRHYLEMVAAMFGGMILLGPVVLAVLAVTGHGGVSSNAGWAAV